MEGLIWVWAILGVSAFIQVNAINEEIIRIEIASVGCFQCFRAFIRQHGVRRIQKMHARCFSAHLSEQLIGLYGCIPELSSAGKRQTGTDHELCPGKILKKMAVHSHKLL